MVDGAEVWNSCKQPASLSSFSCLQTIQHLPPSTILSRQYDIQIPKNGFKLQKCIYFLAQAYILFLFCLSSYMMDSFKQTEFF